MKTKLIVPSLLLAAVVGFGRDIPADFRGLILFQTPDEWKMCVMSSHLDVLEDAPPDSPHVGKTPESITAITKIVVSVPQPEKLGTRLSEESIYSAIHDYVLISPTSSCPASEHWVEVTGPETQQYRIYFLNGRPSEAVLRKDENTLIRFGLNKVPESMTPNVTPTADVASLEKEAHSLAAKNDTQGLFAVANSLIEKAPLSSSGYEWRGCAFADMGKNEEALNDLNKAIQLDPKNNGAFSSLSRLQSTLGNLKEALIDIDQAIVLWPSYAPYHVRRGKIHDRLNDRVLALSDYHEALRCDPKSAEALEALGTLERMDNQYDQAIEDLTNCITIDKNRPWAFFFRAASFFAKKDWPSAKRDIEESIRLDPSYSQAHSIHAMILIAMGDYQSALAATDFGLKHSQPIAEIYNARAVAHVGLKDFDAAIADEEMALKVEPDDKQAKANLESLKKGAKAISVK